MNLISWNCKGLGASRAIHEVTKLVRKFNPQILFLIETKRKNNEMDWLRSRWNYDNCFTVDCMG